MENNLSPLDQAVIMSEEEMKESLGGACKQTCKVCAESCKTCNKVGGKNADDTPSVPIS